MKKLLRISKQLKSVLGLTIILSLSSVFSSCNKNKPKSTTWYIYEAYFKVSPSTGGINTMGVGPDHELNLKNDGTIEYSVLGQPATFWGSYTNTTITFGTGGSGSVVYQITNQDSHIIEASYAYPNTTGVTYLTLKR
jgi:hypothetical protein